MGSYIFLEIIFLGGLEAGKRTVSRKMPEVARGCGSKCGERRSRLSARRDENDKAPVRWQANRGLAGGRNRPQEASHRRWEKAYRMFMKVLRIGE